jgi:hypothetical protein
VPARLGHGQPRRQSQQQRTQFRFDDLARGLFESKPLAAAQFALAPLAEVSMSAVTEYDKDGNPVTHYEM